MSAIELRRRIDRAIERGKGSMMLTQSDLDVWLESGAYKSLSEFADMELCRKRKDQSRYIKGETTNSTDEATEQILKSSGMIEQPDVKRELARALATLPKPSRRSTASISVKKPAPPADAPTKERAA